MLISNEISAEARRAIFQYIPKPEDSGGSLKCIGAQNNENAERVFLLEEYAALQNVFYAPKFLRGPAQDSFEDEKKKLTLIYFVKANPKLDESSIVFRTLNQSAVEELQYTIRYELSQLALVRSFMYLTITVWMKWKERLIK